MKNLFEYTDITKDEVLSTEVVIIGSGCGGATLAKRLTDLGVDVIILEQGGYYPASSMDQNELNMAGKISANRNFKTSHDGGNLLVYGNNVGGASVHYWADSYRTPKWKLDSWESQYGVTGHQEEDLSAAWDEIEKSLNVHEAEDGYMNRMNQLMEASSKKLGWHGHRVPQARKGCAKSGHCMQGCMYNAKQSQMVTHIPAALNKGARLYADAKASKMVHENGEVKGLLVDIINRATNEPSGIKLTIKAKQYVVAAGGFSSAFWLKEQGLDAQLPHLGKHFSMNPSAMVHGLYDENITLWRNIPAGWGIDEFLQRRYANEQYQEGGYLLMPNQIQPALFAAMVPGFGDVHSEFMQKMPNVGGTISWIDDVETELGEIQMTEDGAKSVVYEYGPKTQAVLRDSVRKQVQLQFAAGAKKVVIAGHQGITLDSPEQIDKIDDLIIQAGGLFLASPHPGGGCCMGRSAQDSVVGSDHRVHGFSNLFVSDSSVFPTSSGVDPSLTIMGFSYIAAQHIHQALKV